jgi:hypothetical protein
MHRTRIERLGQSDESAGVRPACSQGHLKRIDHELSAQVRHQGPADTAPTERVEHDGNKDERSAQPNICYIGDPQLIDATRRE